MLLILNRSLWQTDICTISRLVTAKDDILLIQNAVTAAMVKNLALKKLINMPTGLYVLQEDVIARGLSHFVAKEVMLIDYAGFVTLTLKHRQQIIW